VQGDGSQIEWSKKKARKTFDEGIKIAVVIREHPELLNFSTQSSPLPNAAGCSCFREHVTFSVHCRNRFFACTYKSHRYADQCVSSETYIHIRVYSKERHNRRGLQGKKRGRLKGKAQQERLARRETALYVVFSKERKGE